MKKRPALAILLALLAAYSASACIDLRETDPCQSLALAVCEKTCGSPSGDTCAAPYLSACLTAKRSTSEIDRCVRGLKSSTGCVTFSELPPACEGVIAEIGGLGDDCRRAQCQAGLTCSFHGCSRPCEQDEDCSGLLSRQGRRAYCSEIGDCRQVCESDDDCGLLTCVPRRDGIKICDPILGPRPFTSLGDICVPYDCDPLSTDGCVLGYCSKACDTNEDCDALNGQNLPSACVLLDGQGFCQPTCVSDVDCVPRSCNEVATIDGTTARTCIVERGSARLGDACVRDDDCRDARAFCSGVCVAPCESDADCSYETSTGEAARCARTFSGQVCVAGCNGAGIQCSPTAACMLVSEGNEVCVP
jgi:hypothetical protein